MAIYVLADIGSVLGGWSSSRLIQRGFSIGTARKLAMLGCALVVMPVAFSMSASTVWGAVALIGLGILGLSYGNSAAIWGTIPKSLPGRSVLIDCCAVIELATGIGPTSCGGYSSCRTPHPARYSQPRERESFKLELRCRA